MPAVQKAAKKATKRSAKSSGSRQLSASRKRALAEGRTMSAKKLEAAFVKVAKQFSENREVTYGAWRDAGVSADVLRRAGIARTRR